MAAGARVVEIGCGPEGCLELLARRVGPKGTDPLVHVYPPGHGRRRILLDFAENLSERIVAQKLIGQRALTELKTALERHLDDPGTLVVSHLYLQAWGRKPAS